MPWFYPLELLCMVVRRGSDSTRLAVARQADRLNSIFMSHLNGDDAVEFNNMIISHALEAAFTADPPLEPPVVSSEQLLRLTESVARGVSLHGYERASVRSTAHGLAVLAIGRFRHELDNPSWAIRRTLLIFAALTTSEDLSMRALALRVFLPPKFSDKFSRTSGEDATTPLSRRIPDDLRQLIETHGPGQSQADLVQEGADAFQTAVSTLFRTHDLCHFGSTVAELLQCNPYVHAMLKSSFPTGDDTPYADLNDCLLATIKALCETDSPSGQDTADIVELGRLAIFGPADELLSTARSVLARNAQLTYACAVLCRSTRNREEALRTAERGLASDSTSSTPSLRRELLLSAMNDAFGKGWTLLLCGELEDPNRRAWGKQYVTAGAKYMDELLHDRTLPLDSPDLWLTLNWAFVHTVFSSAGGDDLEADIDHFKVSRPLDNPKLKLTRCTCLSGHTASASRGMRDYPRGDGARRQDELGAKRPRHIPRQLRGASQ